MNSPWSLAHHVLSVDQRPRPPHPEDKYSAFHPLFVLCQSYYPSPQTKTRQPNQPLTKTMIPILALPIVTKTLWFFFFCFTFRICKRQHSPHLTAISAKKKYHWVWGEKSCLVEQTTSSHNPNRAGSSLSTYGRRAHQTKIYKR